MSDPDAPDYWAGSDDQGEAWPPREAPDASPISEDTAALLAFAASIRGTAWSTQLGAAMVAAAGAGWAWKRAAAFALRLVIDEDAEPRFITEATRDPLKRATGPSEPSPEWREARERLRAAQDGAA